MTIIIMAERSRLAIIGGGASAALLLAHLARDDRAKLLDIDVFDRSARFGRGVAYSTEYAAHRLNVRAANMSAYADTPDDFSLWVKDRYTFESDAFVPRGLYALYLDEKIKDAAAKLSVKFIQADVLGSQKTNNDLFALKTDNFYQSYSAVVQATGNVRLLQPVLRGTLKHYYAEPWYVESFRDIPANGRVVLLGSGLSAADAVNSLYSHDFKGEIVIISRNGWFPCLHTEPCKYAPFLEASDLTLPPSALMRKIRDQVADAGSAGVPWQAVIDSLRPFTNTIWQNWGARERSVFMRRAFTAWNVHRHRMAPDTARVIADYASRGKLKIVRDTILHVEAPTRVVCKGGAMDADAIVNCLGYRYDEGRAFDVSHTIGPAAFGPLLETTAIPEIRTQAAQIAADILGASNIQKRPE